MIQLIFYLIQLIFSFTCLFVNKSTKTAGPSASFEGTPVSSPKSKGNAGAKKKKPKRNRSAFIIFSSEQRAQLKAQNGDVLNSNEMMVKLAELWKLLSQNVKDDYSRRADDEKVRYLQDLNEFHACNPDEIIQNKTKKNHIKKPCSAYALFLKDSKKDIKDEQPDLKMADILKVVAQRWRELDDNTRTFYQQKAHQEKEMTLAKVNEQLSKNGDTVPAKKNGQKEQQSRKSQRTQLKETIKIEDVYTYSETRSHPAPSEYQDEEPALQKHRVLNVPSQLPSIDSFNGFCNNTYVDYFLGDLQAFTKAVSQNSQIQNQESFLSKNESIFWQLNAMQQPTRNFSNDTIDLMNFGGVSAEQAKQFPKLDYIEEDQGTTHYSQSPSATRTSPQDLVMSLLDSESYLSLTDDFEEWDCARVH